MSDRTLDLLTGIIELVAVAALAVVFIVSTVQTG